ncbi:MerR family DNA-binding transcriptional regulator [Kineosporia mesophila]|nr:MerR family DNA-binding transcriptional regulator [Kineosporia mesophila]MCD5354423.1 MerR family DNA-binding transcriptional regulator [Kineosporia mesophila]
MRIGELADRTAVSIRSLRYYEEQGLLPPERNDGGRRTYTQYAVE